jgi:hypothetical protein
MSPIWVLRRVMAQDEPRLPHGTRNISYDDSLDYRYRSGKSACLGCARRSHSDAQGCHAGRRVATYLRSMIQGQESLGEDRVAECLVDSRFFDTKADDQSTAGVDGLLAAMEDKRVEASLNEAAKAQAAHTF